MAGSPSSSDPDSSSQPAQASTSTAAHGRNHDGKPRVAIDDFDADNNGSDSLGNHNAHKQRFSFLATIGLAYAILNSVTAMSASLSLVLPSGGPVAMLWGLVISAISVLAIATSMAEMCAVLPTSGGPYHWTYCFAPAKIQVPLAYAAGWILAGGWVCLVATASSLGSTFILNIISLMNPAYEEQPWHNFLLFVAFSLLGWAINVFGAKILDLCNRTALFWSLIGAVAIVIVCLATATPQYRTGTQVFGTFVNETGWDNFVAFLLGMLQSTFGLVGVDGVTHIVDEMPRPSRDAPRAMIAAPIIGAAASWIVLMVLLFCLNDYDAVIESSAGPLLTIFYQSTGSRGGSVALLMFPLIAMVWAAIGILTASSRTTQSFAADRGLPFSNFFSSETKKIEVPVPAITLNTVFVIIFGCIYLGSSSALNAILSASVVLLQFSYAIPIFLVLVRGRHLLDEVSSHGVGHKRAFNLGKWGYLVGGWAVFFCIFTDIFFLFPPERPVTGPSMNYTVVAVAVVFLLAVFSWIFHGRKHYKGPQGLERALVAARRGVEDHVLAEKDTQTVS